MQGQLCLGQAADVAVGDGLKVSDLIDLIGPLPLCELYAALGRIEVAEQSKLLSGLSAGSLRSAKPPIKMT